MLTKVLFLTDSLGTPRLVPSPVFDDDVWTYRVVASQRARIAPFFYTLNGLHTGLMRQGLANVLGAFRPEIVILQIGIVDCAPKALKENELKVVTRLPAVLNRPIHRFVKRNYQALVKLRDITYVSRDDFRANLRAVAEHFSRASFVVVPIGPPNTAYKAKNPLMERNIGDYNDVLASVFGDAFAAEIYAGVDLEAFYLADNHHLSPHGHRTVAERVERRLDALLDRFGGLNDARPSGNGG